MRFINANHQKPKAAKRSQSRKNEQEILHHFDNATDTTEESPMKYQKREMMSVRKQGGKDKYI